MKFFKLCLLLLISGKCLSQENRIILKFCPFALIDPATFPSIQAGLEFNLTKQIGIYGEFGYKMTYLDDSSIDTSFVSSKGLKIKTEIRYYLNKKRIYTEKTREFYIATNLFFTKDSHNTSIHYTHKEDTLTELHDQFGVRKNVSGANLLAGYQRSILLQNLICDLYVGFGVRFITVKTLDKEFDFEKDELHGPIDVTVKSFSDRTDAKSGKSVRPNLTVGARICYVFKY